MIVSTDYKHLRVGTWQSEISRNEVFRRFPDKRSWWIDSSGEVFDAGHDHQQYIKDHPELFDPNEIILTYHAVKKFWVRVSLWGPSFAINARNINQAQLDAAQILYMREGGGKQVEFFQEGVIQTSFDKEEFLELKNVNQLKRMRSRIGSSPSDAMKEKHPDKRSWWVDPQGKIFDSGHDHNKFLEERPKIFGKWADINKALTMNWVRVAFWGGEYVVHCHNITRAQLAACQQIYKSLGVEYKIYISTLNKYGYISPHDFIWADSQTDLIKNLFKDPTGIRASVSASASEWMKGKFPDKRSWWIDPYGEVYDAGHNHDEFVIKHPELFGTDEPDYVADFGWVRVGSMGQDFAIAAKSLSQKKLDEAQRLYYETNKPYVIVVIGNRNGRITKDEFLQANSVADLLKALRVTSGRQANGSERAWMLSPQGELISCAWDHDAYVKQHEEEFGIQHGDPNPVETLISQGWTKVGMLGRIAYFVCKRITQKILDEIHSFVLKDSYIQDVQVIDYSLAGGEALELPRDEFLQMNKPSNLRWMFNIRGSRRSSRTGFEERAWIISPANEVISCGWDHNKFIRSNPERFGVSPDVDPNSPEFKDPSRWLVENGWTKIGKHNTIIYFECFTLTQRLLNTLQDFVKRDPEIEYVQSVIYLKPSGDPIIPELKRNEFIWLDKPSDLIKRSHVRARKQASNYEGRAWVISPEGETYNCGDDHSSCVYEGPLDQLWFEEGFEEADRSEKNTIIGKWLDRNGWAKVGYFNNIRLVYLFVRKLDNRMFKAFKEILSGLDLDDRAQIEVSDPSRSVFWWEDFRWFDSVLDMKKFTRGVASRRRSASLPKSRNFLMGIDLEGMPWPLRKALDLLNLSEKKDKLSANQVASVFQANDEFLQDHVGRTATELIQELNAYFQYGMAQEQIA